MTLVRTKITLVILLALVLIAAIIFGGWKLNWWFKAQNVNQQAHITRNSYGNQQTLRDQVVKDIGNITDVSVQIEQNPADAQTLVAQRIAELRILCHDADQISGDALPSDQATFVAANCTAGNINPYSPLVMGK